MKLLTVAEDLLVLAIGVVAQQDFAVLGPGVVPVDAFAWGVVFKGHDLCVDIAETLERLQDINPEQYAWWYSKLYPTDNPPGDEWTSYTLATLRNLIRWKGYCEASLDLSNQDEVGDPVEEPSDAE